MESVLGSVGGGMMMVVSGGVMDGGAGGCLRGTGACVLMFPAAVGSLRAIPRTKKPSLINGSAPAASKSRTGEKILKF